MRALTLIRPWSDAIVRGPKRVENRGWLPAEPMFGEVIALHAGAKYLRPQWMEDPDAWKMPAEYEPPPDGDCPRGIVGVARLLGALDTRRGRRRIVLPVAHVDGLAERLWTLDQDPWWSGPCGILLGDVVAIEPIAHRGALGLWPVPETIEARVMRAAEAA